MKKSMCNWTRETFCIYRIFASQRTLLAWTPPLFHKFAAEFSMLQNCIVAHSMFRRFPVDAGRRPSERCTHRERISERFLERFSRDNKRREGRGGGRRWCFTIKRIQLTVIVVAGIPTFIREMTSRIVIHPLYSRYRNGISNACVCELEMSKHARKEEDTNASLDLATQHQKQLPCWFNQFRCWNTRFIPASNSTDESSIERMLTITW